MARPAERRPRRDPAGDDAVIAAAQALLRASRRDPHRRSRTRPRYGAGLSFAFLVRRSPAKPSPPGRASATPPQAACRSRPCGEALMDLDDIAAASGTAPPPVAAVAAMNTLRARAAWHFGRGPEYCRGCAAVARDCGAACPYAAHSPLSLEGHACWAAGIASAEASMAGLTLDTAGALSAARELGATGWVAAELLLALRIGMAEGSTARREGETS